MLIASCSLHHLLSLFFPQVLYLALSQSLPFAEFWLIVFLCLSVPVKKVSIGSTDIYVLWIILLDKWTYWRLPGKARLLSLLNAFTICISTSIANQLSNLEWCRVFPGNELLFKSLSMLLFFNGILVKGLK